MSIAQHLMQHAAELPADNRMALQRLLAHGVPEEDGSLVLVRADDDDWKGVKAGEPHRENYRQLQLWRTDNPVLITGGDNWIFTSAREKKTIQRTLFRKSIK